MFQKWTLSTLLNLLKSLLVSSMSSTLFLFSICVQGQSSEPATGSSLSLSIVPRPENKDALSREPTSVQNRNSAGSSLGVVSQGSQSSRTVRDETELQVQHQLFKPDRKTSRERKLMNFEAGSEEE
jgi:hypothetical protein